MQYGEMEQNQDRSEKQTVRLEETSSLFCCGSNSFSPLICTLSLLSFHHPLSLPSTSASPAGGVKRLARTALKILSPTVMGSRKLGSRLAEAAADRRRPASGTNPRLLRRSSDVTRRSCKVVGNRLRTHSRFQAIYRFQLQAVDTRRSIA